MSAPLVLCYHAVSETWPAALSIAPDRFDEHLALLRRRGLRGVTFTEAATGAAGPDSVAITFDDAFRSVYAHAFPLLRRHGFPATVFAPTDFPDGRRPLAWDGTAQWGTGPHAGELEPMDWDELGELAQEGWEVGSHTCSHPRLTSLGAAELRDELVRSRETCAARVGRPCTSLAYPYGDVDGRVAEAAGVAGYTAAGALDGRLERLGPLRYPRVGVYHGDAGWRLRLKLSPVVAAVRRSPLWGARLALGRRAG